MAASEVYPNAPIAMVVAEIRHPASDALSSAEWSNIKQALSAVTPVARTENAVEIDLQSGSQKITKLTRFVSRDLHQSISFKQDAIVVESTDYAGWDSFIQMAQGALSARQDIAPVDGLERIGLRYIDEIRPPNLTSSTEANNWKEWVSAELLGPISLQSAVNHPITGQQGVAVLSASPGITYTLRYGSGAGQAFASSPNLKRRTEPSGSFFLIDIDGAWDPTEALIPEFSVSKVIETLNQLHKPISAIFESLITDRLRNEVLRIEHNTTVAGH